MHPRDMQDEQLSDAFYEALKDSTQCMYLGELTEEMVKRGLLATA